MLYSKLNCLQEIRLDNSKLELSFNLLWVELLKKDNFLGLPKIIGYMYYFPLNNTFIKGVIYFILFRGLVKEIVCQWKL